MRRKGRAAASPVIPTLGPSSESGGRASLEKRVEHLERELQAVTTRLEQAQSSRSMQVDELAARVEEAVELAGTQREQQRGVGERLEAQLQRVVAALREDQEHQQVEWLESARRLMEHVEQLESRVERVDGRATAQTGRHLSELAQLHRDFAAVALRVERLGQRVNAVMDEVTADFEGRMALLAQRLEAGRETDADERLAELDRFATRLAELESHQAQLVILAAALEARRQPMLPAPDAGSPGGKVVDLNSRRRDGSSSGPSLDEDGAEEPRTDGQHAEHQSMPTPSRGRLLDVVDLRDPPSQQEAELAAVSRDQDWLRHELEGLAGRVDELARRLDRTERLASSAGRVVARLLRTLRATNGGPARRV